MMFFVHQLSYHLFSVGALVRGRYPHSNDLIRSRRRKKIEKNREWLHAGFLVWNVHGCRVYNLGRPVIILVKKPSKTLLDADSSCPQKP